MKCAINEVYLEKNSLSRMKLRELPNDGHVMAVMQNLLMKWQTTSRDIPNGT